MTIRFPAAILMSCLISVTITAEDVKRPNILFIVVDDQSPFDLKIYNPQSSLETPTLDRLAAEGMVFDGAYLMGSFSGAVCTPSRHMLMSGRTVWHLPICRNLRSPSNLTLRIAMPYRTLDIHVRDLTVRLSSAARHALHNLIIQATILWPHDGHECPS